MEGTFSKIIKPEEKDSLNKLIDMVDIKNVSFSYPNSRLLLKNVSFSIKAGEIVALVGHSGCGKTTILNLIAGILLPSSGTVAVNVDSMSYLMQDLTLLSYQTAFENCFLSCVLKGQVIDKELESKALYLLHLFNFEKSDYDKYPSELSGGMKQRIGLIQALLADSPLMLLDEPFNAIDNKTVQVIEDYIWNTSKNNNKKNSLVFITHNFDQALSLCDRVFIVKNAAEFCELPYPKEFIKLSPIERQNTETFSRLYYEAIRILTYEE